MKIVRLHQRPRKVAYWVGYGFDEVLVGVMLDKITADQEVELRRVEYPKGFVVTDGLYESYERMVAEFAGWADLLCMFWPGADWKSRYVLRAFFREAAPISLYMSDGRADHYRPGGHVHEDKAFTTAGLVFDPVEGTWRAQG